jgi:hypothetical protein
MENINWTHFLLLWGGAVGGTVAIIPYAFILNKEQLAEVPMPKWKLITLSVIQGTILFAILTLLGLLASDAIKLSISSSNPAILTSAMIGIVASIVLISIEVIIFRPYLPPALQESKHDIALWKRFLACFYGGISEEILTRLFLVSGMTWLISQITQQPTDATVGYAIVLSALIFGIGHLPATVALTKLTPIVIIRALVLNGLIGIVFGWIFWTNGLVATMVAHFCADIVLHVLSPYILKPIQSKSDMTSIQPI